jgi:hypothetical protein
VEEELEEEKDFEEDGWESSLRSRQGLAGLAVMGCWGGDFGVTGRGVYSALGLGGNSFFPTSEVRNSGRMCLHYDA